MITIKFFKTSYLITIISQVFFFIALCYEKETHYIYFYLLIYSFFKVKDCISKLIFINENWNETLFCILFFCLSDGSLGSLQRWRSQRIAKCQSCELQDTLALYRAVEHLTYWTNISHCRFYIALAMSAARLVESAFLIFKYVFLHVFFIWTVIALCGK